ncbi:MAG: tetratricopeptide repeat protein [Bacteroidota bacterium]
MKSFLWMLFFSPLFLWGQPEWSEAQVDSLNRVRKDITQEPKDRLQASQALVLDVWLYRFPDSAYQIAKEMEILAKDTDDSLYLGSAYSYLGMSQDMQGYARPAVEYWGKALEIFQGLKDTLRIGRTLRNLGQGYEGVGDMDQAIDMQTQSLRIKEQLRDTVGIASSYKDIAFIYEKLKDYESALEYFEKSMVLYEQLGDRDGVASVKLGQGAIYGDLDQRDKELQVLQEALAIDEEINDQVGIAAVLTNLGNHYYETDQLELAEAYHLRSLRLSEKIGRKWGVASSYNNLGNVYKSQQDIPKSIIFHEKSFDISKEADIAIGMMYGAGSLSESYRLVGRYKEAIEMFELFIQMKDSIEGEETQRAVMRQDVEYQYEKQALADSLAFEKQQAIAELNYQRQLSRRNYWLFGGLGLAVLAFLFFRYRQQLRSKEKDLALQRERERKEQLDELNQLKSRFFANISHEFRTPLTLVLGQNQQLQAELDDPRLDARFDRIDRNGRRLMELVNQVLDLSKLEAGNMEWKQETVDLIPFLKNALFSFESLAEQQQQQLSLDHEEESLLMVADPEKLERVFFNLLSNALKFTPKGGQIQLSIQRTDAEAVIGVQDTGLGIAPEEIDQIFDRFYQASNGGQPANPGTGIGLALAKELVELHQGRMEVSSTLGEGTEFLVFLPISAATGSLPATYQPQLEPLELIPQKAIAPHPKRLVAQANERILLVEDNADVRAYLKEELLSLGYQVEEAEHGKAGLRQARLHQPDLIISDVRMPEMDGFAFAEAIRNEVESSHIPLILLTAKASEESRLTGLMTGADAYLTKPFNRAELQVRVAKLIEQRRMLRQRFSEAITIRPEEVSVVPLDQAFLASITQEIEANLTNEAFGVENLSEAMAMSVTHLNRKLNALIGQSGGKLIRKMRLQRAADLLKQQAGTVAEVGYDLGFGSPASFTRAFKAQFGVSPTEYLKQANS